MKRSIVRAVLIGALASTAAGAQVINYSTQGFFSGPESTASGVTCTTVAALTASCSSDGFKLVFNGTSGVNLASNTITSLGMFSLVGSGTTMFPTGSLFFTLLVSQTTPSVGQGTFVGAVTGTVSNAGGVNFSSLMWAPNQTTSIGATTYEVFYDAVGPAANKGLGIPINNVRGVNALVATTTTPEPATVTLVVTGIAGLLPMIRRRRKQRPTA